MAARLPSGGATGVVVRAGYARRVSGTQWNEIGDGVFVRRHEQLDLNCGLVVGEDRCLVIDTRGDIEQGRELAGAVRQITPLEPVVVNTHAHYDHCFGNGAFADSQIYAHSEALADLVSSGEQQRGQVVQQLLTQGKVEQAHVVRETELVLPFYVIEQDTAVQLGGRDVHLLVGGRGHTNHDVVVAVPDAEVVFWGDLVEEGADPAMEDGFPLEWSETLTGLGRRRQVRNARVAVPGHGAVLDPTQVDRQRGQLAALARGLRARMEQGGCSVDELAAAVTDSGLQAETIRLAATRAVGAGDR